MSLAKSLLERHKKLKSSKRIKEDMDVAPEANPEIVEAVKWLKENNWSENNDMQASAADQMKSLSESDCEDSNKFMEYMDDAASKYESEEEVEDDEIEMKKPASTGATAIPEEDEMEDEMEDEDEVEEDEDDSEEIEDESDEDEVEEDDSEEMEDEDEVEEDDSEEIEDESDEDEVEEDDDSEEDDSEEDDSEEINDEEEDEDEDEVTTEKFKKKK
jgi:hypothetical protein